MEVNFTRSCVNEEEAYNLTGLQAFTEYVVTLQCVVNKSRFWSGWSQEKRGITVEEGKLVPCVFFFAPWGIARLLVRGGQAHLSFCYGREEWKRKLGTDAAVAKGRGRWIYADPLRREVISGWQDRLNKLCCCHGNQRGLCGGPHSPGVMTFPVCD